MGSAPNSILASFFLDSVRGGSRSESSSARGSNFVWAFFATTFGIRRVDSIFGFGIIFFGSFNLGSPTYGCFNTLGGTSATLGDSITFYYSWTASKINSRSTCGGGLNTDQ